MESLGEPPTRNLPDKSPAGRKAWRKKLAVLAHRTKEARRGLVERVARRRAFGHLDEEISVRPESYPKILDRVTDSYLDGTFYLRQMGPFGEVSPELSLVVYNLRQEWVRQYNLTTVPSFFFSIRRCSPTSTSSG